MNNSANPRTRRHAVVSAGLALALICLPGTAPAQDASALAFAGNVVASELVGLSYRTRGCITQVSQTALDGGIAASGEVLVELESRSGELALESARARLADLEAALEAGQLAIDSAEADHARREQEEAFVAREFERNDTMFKRGLINETTMEAVESRMMNARFAVARAGEALASARSALKRAEIAVELGRLDVERAELDLAHLRLLAPFDGVLIGFDPHVGDCVQEGAPAAQIYAPSRKSVEYFVRIDELLKLHHSGVSVGSPVTITRRNGQTCAGVVTWIDTETNLETQYVKSSIDLDETCAVDLFINEAVVVAIREPGPDQAGTATPGVGETEQAATEEDS